MIDACYKCGCIFDEKDDSLFCTECGTYRYYAGINNLDKDLLIAFYRDGKQRSELKRRLVQVTSHGGACDICKKFEKQVFVDDVFTYMDVPIDNVAFPLLSDAIRRGLFHNGCRHGMTTYYPELEDLKK